MDHATEECRYRELARDHVGLADQITRRLMRRYGWVGWDELQGYAYLGLTLAARAWDPERGLSFKRFACTKAMFLAVDEMRKDGVLRRADIVNDTQEQTGIEIDIVDDAARRDRETMEARDLCARLVSKLRPQDRELLQMIYNDHLTYKEIAAVYNITESAVCLRHKAVIEKLRRDAAVRRLAA
jgi:RNA polymerase sigma factor (sigma-70 family)